MYHAIVFFPLIGALIAGLFGRLIGARMSELVTTGCLAFAALLSWGAFFLVTGCRPGPGRTAESTRWPCLHQLCLGSTLTARSLGSPAAWCLPAAHLPPPEPSPHPDFRGAEQERGPL